MTAEMTRKINQALDALDRAIAGALAAVRPIALDDRALSHRMESYKEVVRRQRVLVAHVEQASKRRDWQEVTRLTDLVRTSSMMIKLDAGHILESLRALRQTDQHQQ
jgi:hypothetical protein